MKNIFSKIIEKVEIYYVMFRVYLFNIFNPDKAEKAVDFSYKYLNKPIFFWQVREEIQEVIKIFEGKNPKFLVEIGTAGGGSLFLLSRIASRDASLISIDLPPGKFVSGYPESRRSLYKSFARLGQRIYLIRKDSHNLKTLDEVKNILGNNKLDLLFIDGDHSLEGVKRDFELYGPLVKDGGFIILHDIVTGPARAVGGVPEFWAEIKKRYKYYEIVKDWGQGGYGIGIIHNDTKKSQRRYG
jgi:predicted O-methyltransferase YrrM